MIEHFDDVFSLLILFSIPLGVIIYQITKFMKMKKEKVLSTSEKYYREW